MKFISYISPTNIVLIVLILWNMELEHCPLSVHTIIDFFLFVTPDLFKLLLNMTLFFFFSFVMLCCVITLKQ